MKPTIRVKSIVAYTSTGSGDSGGTRWDLDVSSEAVFWLVYQPASVIGCDTFVVVVDESLAKDMVQLPICKGDNVIHRRSSVSSSCLDRL